MIKKEFEHYLLYVMQMSKATVNSYLSDVSLFEKEIEKNLLEVEPHDVLDYFHQLSKTLTSSTTSRKMSALRSFYHYVNQINKMDYDPTALLKISNQKKPLPHYLTLSEMKLLISFEIKEAQDYLDRALIEVLFSCGLRVSEVTDLLISQYYKQEGFFKVLGKGNKERIVPLHKAGQKVINDYINNARNLYNIKNSSHLFINHKSLPLTRQSVYNRLKKRAEQVGLNKKISPHILRHSFASALINNDADLRVVQELLGHQSIATTQIYTHLQSDSKKRMYDQFHPGQQIQKGQQDDE